MVAGEGEICNSLKRAEEEDGGNSPTVIFWNGFGTCFRITAQKEGFSLATWEPARMALVPLVSTTGKLGPSASMWG